MTMTDDPRPSTPTRIPITMCHGTRPEHRFPLPVEHFDRLIHIAADMGFTSIDYDDLAAWRAGERELPARPIMFDFDHPVQTMGREVRSVLDQYGFHGTLFINTGVMDDATRPPDYPPCMTWEEVGRLRDAGWHIGAHTVTHPNLSRLFLEDPSGTRLQEELEQCDAAIESHLGVRPRDFAFTGTSWSSAAEQRVMARYRFGRLWIVGSMYDADGQKVRYADLAGVQGADAADGGPPMAARYITRQSHPYRLPSMEFQSPLMHEPAAFRRYLEGAVVDGGPPGAGAAFAGAPRGG
jgi:peptidoglycan/xylan/chitin deacetylase (PgdA/CDA1 family)